MADSFLTAGATSLAAANWSDATGFADNATLFVQSGSQTITAGLAPSLTNGIQNFDVLPGFSGLIGGASGSLAVETRSSLLNQELQIPRVRWFAGGGSLYYSPQGAGAASNVCDYLQINTGGSANITGTGTVRRLELEAGRLFVAEPIGGITAYRWVFSGGSSTIDGVTGSTKLFSLTVTGGVHTIKKGFQGGTVTANGVKEGLIVAGGSVTLDAFGETVSNIQMCGGTLRVLNSGAIACITGSSGTLDFSQLQRPVTLTLLEDMPGLTVIPSPLLTITARNPVGTGAEGLT
jgi:hypothetical protein